MEWFLIKAEPEKNQLLGANAVILVLCPARCHAVCGTQIPSVQRSKAPPCFWHLSTQPFTAVMLWQWEGSNSGKCTLSPFPPLLLIMCFPLHTKGLVWDKVLLTKGQLMAGRDRENLQCMPHKRAWGKGRLAGQHLCRHYWEKAPGKGPVS